MSGIWDPLSGSYARELRGGSSDARGKPCYAREVRADALQLGRCWDPGGGIRGPGHLTPGGSWDGRGDRTRTGGRSRVNIPLTRGDRPFRAYTRPIWGLFGASDFARNLSPQTWHLSPWVCCTSWGEVGLGGPGGAVTPSGWRVNDQAETMSECQTPVRESLTPYLLGRLQPYVGRFTQHLIMVDEVDAQRWLPSARAAMTEGRDKDADAFWEKRGPNRT